MGININICREQWPSITSFIFIFLEGLSIRVKLQRPDGVRCSLQTGCEGQDLNLLTLELKTRFIKYFYTYSFRQKILKDFLLEMKIQFSVLRNLIIQFHSNTLILKH